MSDGDERFGSLPQALPVEIGDAVLGHHVVNVGPAGYDSRACVEHGRDARNCSVFRGGLEGDDRLAAFRAGCAANEIDLPAEAAVGPRADGVGAHLAGEIHLNGGVDGHHAVVARDGERIVRVAGGPHLEDRVVVHELEQAARAERKADENLAAMDLFAVAGEDARLDQVDDAVRAHLAVHAEVFMVAEAAEHGVGHTADSGLKNGSVRYQRRDMRGDAALDVRRRLHRKLEQRAVGFDDGVDLADVDEALAVGARHLPVHLDDEMARAETRGHAAIDGRAKAEKPVVVGGLDCRNATSIGIWPLVNSSSISLRKIGV